MMASMKGFMRQELFQRDLSYITFGKLRRERRFYLLRQAKGATETIPCRKKTFQNNAQNFCFTKSFNIRVQQETSGSDSVTQKRT